VTQTPIATAWTVAAALLWGTARAALPEVANPSFEAGAQVPAGWTATGPTEWGQGPAADGTRFATVRAGGQWASAPLTLEPGAAYELCARYRLRSDGGVTAAGYAVIGPDFGIQVVRLTPAQGEPRWQEHRLRFAAPDATAVPPPHLTLGQWQLQGVLDFDQVELHAVRLSHLACGETALGEGESLSGDRYRFSAPLETWRTVSRPLAGFTALFHDNRWRFMAGGQYVVYRHALAGRRQVRATVRPTVWFHEATSLGLQVEASADGQAYRLLGSVRHGQPAPALDLPADMLPAAAVWVRLRCDASDTSQPVFFQVTGYEYDAAVDGTGPDGAGRSAALTVLAEDEAIEVLPANAVTEPPTLAVRVRNRGPAALALAPELAVRDPFGRTATIRGEPLTLAADAVAPVRLPYDTAQAGLYVLELTLGPGHRTRLASEATVCVLDVSHYGEGLPSPDPDVALWWATAGWRISRTRPAPSAAGRAVVIRLAGNESEGAQLVVRPERPLRELTAAVDALRTAAGDTLPAAAVQVLAVDYVAVQYASDEFGRTGLWPDPLPPLAQGVDVPAGVNQPLWLSVQAPADVRPGLYQGQVTLTAAGYSATVPLEVEVFGFALPAASTCRTLFGFSAGNVLRYHNLQTDGDRRRVMDQYLRSFAEHRISPYDPAPLDRFTYQWRTGSRWQGGRVVSDRPHAGQHCLFSEDTSTTSAPQANYAEPISVAAAPLRLRLWYRTSGPDPALAVLSYLDAGGSHIPNRNKHAQLPGSSEWRPAEFTFADPPPGAKSATPAFLGCEWTPGGDKTGSVWVDEVSLTDTASGRELIEDGGFENAVPLAGADLVRFDWERWDQAMVHAVNEYHFNSFVFNVPGLGGGTFHARYPGELCGYGEGTPEYAALLKAWCDAAREHLAARGLLDRAVVYPFDEPDTKDYPFVCSQLRRLKDSFPGLRRMVPMNLGAAEDFLGLIDLWCPIMDSHQREFAAGRQQAGDLYTWYICCGPKAPYIANFIDRAGTDLRLWFWQAWQEHVDGALIWETVWWTSSAAYPDAPQNPYLDAMSWVDGYGTPRGEKRRWNVGDGRFLYPPRAATGTQTEAVLDGPVTSLRWEALRDGVEDYEYLALLKRLLAERRAGLAPELAAKCEALLQVPADVSASLTVYTQDPAPLLARRLELARAIESLEPR